jgi:hypothetical protein
MKYLILTILMILFTSCNNSSLKTNESRTIVPVLEQQVFRLNSKTKIGGESRITRYIPLPANTVEWYYSVVATRDKKVEPMNLRIQLLRIAELQINNVKIPPGGAYCNVYLLDASNKEKFENGKDFEYIPSGSSKNIREGKFKITNCNSGNWYLGFQNTKNLHYIDVALEVAALVEK